MTRHTTISEALTISSAYQNSLEGYLPSCLDDQFVIPNVPESVAASHKTYSAPPGQSRELEVACDCIACFHTRFFQAIKTPGWFTCSIHGCEDYFCRNNQFASHYYNKHLHREEGKYPCTASNCKHAFKRGSDLFRHNKAVHCLRAEKFPCNVIGCKYGGDNGFTRKDKLKSHVKNAHEGKLPVNQPPRAIQPKVQKK